jgi:hypothetical protein
MAIKFLSAINHGAYQLPTVDGSAGQVLTTDGSGNVTFQSVSSSSNYYLSGASFNTSDGVLTLTVAGATNQTVDLDGRYALSSHVHNYDNYGSWNLKTNGTQRTTVQSGGDLNLVAGSNVSLSYSAGGTVTITSTDTNTDTNYYLTGLSFDTGSGVLSATVNGASNPTVDLDGRYVEIAGDTMTGDLNLGNNSLNAVENIYLDNAIYSQGDTNTYTQFHSGDQWRVVTGGSERLEVTNTHTYLQNILYLNSNLNTTSTSEVHYGNISTSANGTVVRGGFMNPASEGNMVHLPHLVNDLSGFNHWGTISVSGLYKSRSGSSGNYTYGSPVTVSDFDNGAAFDSYSSTAGSWYSDNGGNGIYEDGTDTPGVITLEWTNELTYSAWVGIVFGSGSFTATKVKIEAYRGGAWQTLCDLTDNTSNVVLRQIGSNSGTGSATTKLRYTLGGSINNSYFRIHTLYAANYRAGDNNLANISTDVTRGVHFFEKYKDNYGWGSYFPATNASYDLGSSGRRWKSIYADGGDSTQWNTAYGWGDHSTEGYIKDGNTNWNNTYGFITASSTDTLTNKSGNISMFTNDAGYLTSYTDTNDIDYINSASFNTSNGVITGTGVGNAGFTVDIDGRYLLRTNDTFTGALSINGYIKGNGQELILSAGESHSYATGQTSEIVYINAEAGLEILSSPDNWSTGWAGRNSAYINRADATSYLPGTLTVNGHGNSSQWNTAYDNMITAAAVAGGANKTLTLTQQDGGTITATWTDTDTNDVDYINSASFNTGNGILSLSGVGNAGASVDLDGRYQLAGTYNTVIGTDADITTSGATVIDDIYMTDGVITSHTTRTLTPGDIGAAYYDHFRSLGTTAFTAGGGSNSTITTTQLISEMEGDGAFDSYTSAFKTSWSYASNDDLSDAGNFTETAGSSWLTWTDNSSDSTRGNITALAIAPNTGGSAGRVFIYNDQGSTYDPGWREVWTNMSLDPIINATVSNDTITFTKANGSTFNISTSDANTNYYLDGLSFNTGNGILTASVNGATNQTVDLDGRYQLAGTYNTIIGTDSDINTSGATVIGQLNMTDGVITSHTTRTLDASSLGITQPDPPSLNALNIVGETIEVVFDQSPTPDIDKYEVWSSVSGGSYGLIANIPTEDITPVMTAIDAVFSVSGTQAYRVYAIKNGIYSVAATGSTTFNTPSLSVVNMSVINLNPAYYIQYDLPDSRFIDHIEIYMDAETTSSSLSRSGASLIYSGSNSSYMYQIGASDLDKFHQFWVEVVAN